MTLQPTPQLDLRRLRQFVAVADTGSLTAAAAMLFVSQQAMSSAMRQLEKDVGVRLLERHGRATVLTAAGHELRQGASMLLAAADALGASTRRAALGEAPPFVVGHTPAITSEEAFSKIEPIRASMPERSVTVRQTFPDQIHDALVDGTVDVVLRRGVMTPPDLATAILHYDPLNLAVDSKHVLAGHTDISLPDIADWPLAVWAPPGNSFYTDFLVSACRRAGFEPTLSVNIIQGTPPVTAVVGTDRVALVTAHAGPALNGQVRVLNLADAPRVPVQAVWLPHTISHARTALLEAGKP
ncbi:LysR family transcriptional regulator [Rhodococcus sovatensis]|uniref:LysR family transcriptional regulator n=1 Tax=Rhodococcus sovatensis TaxID=1805840 RepID=A0ABZ2PH57_9NOCA